MSQTNSVNRSGLLRELLVLCVVGLTTAGFLYVVRKSRRLEDQNAALTRLAFGPRAGLYVPEIGLATTNGDPVVLGRIGQRQLLFFFNSTCQYCRETVPYWNQIAESLDTDSSLLILGVAFDDAAAAAAYSDAQEMVFPVAGEGDPRLAGLYRISGVPALVLISDSGRMAYARVGPIRSGTVVDSVVSAVRNGNPQQVEGHE